MNWGYVYPCETITFVKATDLFITCTSFLLPFFAIYFVVRKVGIRSILLANFERIKLHLNFNAVLFAMDLMLLTVDFQNFCACDLST